MSSSSFTPYTIYIITYHAPPHIDALVFLDATSFSCYAYLIFSMRATFPALLFLLNP